MDKLKQWLEKNGQTGADLARGIGVSKTFVYKALGGEKAWGAETASRVKAYTGGEITTDDLLASRHVELPPPPPKLEDEPEEDTPEAADVRRLCVDLNRPLANQMEALHAWHGGTFRDHVEAALRPYLNLYREAELRLIHPQTKDAVIKRRGEEFPPAPLPRRCRPA